MLWTAVDNSGTLIPWDVDDMRLEFGVRRVCVEAGFVKVWLEFIVTVDEPPKTETRITFIHVIMASPTAADKNLLVNK